MINKEENLYNTQIIDLPPVYSMELPTPHIFLCCRRSLIEYTLSGEQRLGRPTDDEIPDIPISDIHVSRRHGYFSTKENIVCYTAEKTINGILWNGRRLKPEEKVYLQDGDELRILLGAEEDIDDIIIICAFSNQKIRFMKGMQRFVKDSLTGLSNRGNFEGWWLKSVRKREYTKACLFILDIDDFKHINDTYGHAAGDDALVLLTEVMKAHVGSEFQLCRWGGDEFVGILPGDVQKVTDLLSRFEKEVAVASKQNGVPFTVSVGLMSFEHITNRYELKTAVTFADQALYEAKHSGGNTLRVYDCSRLQEQRVVK